MNIGDLRKIIAGLPDDTPVVARPDLSYQLLRTPYELDVRHVRPDNLLMDGDKAIKVLIITASDSDEDGEDCGQDEEEK